MIDVPLDVQKKELDFAYPDSVSIRGYHPSTRANPLQLRRVAEAIAAARRPVICAGGGVFSAGARPQMQSFAERCGIPVVTTMMGLGLMPSSHPLYLGMLGSFGCSAANYAIHHSDLLILIGTRAGDRAMRQPGVLERRTRIIHIDIDPAEIRKNMEANIPLVADARLVLEELCETCQAMDTGMWLAELREKQGSGAPFSDRPAFVNPHRLIAALTQALDSDAVYVADVGLNQIWSARSSRIKEGRFLTSGGMGTMGYALPAAMGARLATTARQVVAVMGDGGFQMSMQELATLCQHDIPVKMVVLRNDCLGLLFVHGLIAEHQIKNTAEDRENQNGDNPGDFIRRVVPLGDDPKDDNQTDQLQADISIKPIGGELEHDKQQKTKLHQNRQGDDHHAAA